MLWLRQTQDACRAVAVIEDEVAVVIGHGEPRKAGEWPELSDLVFVEIPFSHTTPAGKIDTMAVAGEDR